MTEESSSQEKQDAVGERRVATEEEIRAMLEGPTIFANRAFVSFDTYGMRITFLEQWPDARPTFRSSVLLSYRSAMQLKNILMDISKEIEDRIDPVQTPADD